VSDGWAQGQRLASRVSLVCLPLFDDPNRLPLYATSTPGPFSHITTSSCPGGPNRQVLEERRNLLLPCSYGRQPVTSLPPPPPPPFLSLGLIMACSIPFLSVPSHFSHGCLLCRHGETKVMAEKLLARAKSNDYKKGAY
jgi:hypothetical protein